MRIKERRLRLGLSQRELADRVGVGVTTVSAWESRQNLPKLSMLPRIAEALETTIAWLQGDPPQGSSYLVRGFIGAGGKTVLLPDDVAKTIDLKLGSGDLEAFEVRSPSVYYREGDILLVDRLNYSHQALIGMECLVTLSSGEIFIAKLMHGSEPGKFTLLSIGGEEFMDRFIDQCRPVVAVIRALPVT